MSARSASLELGIDTENYNARGKDQERPKKQTNFFLEYLRDYVVNSNLPGFKYIAQRELTFIEKVFWLFIVLCCVVICAVLIGKIWYKWNEAPVIAIIGENPKPIWQIPYPAVTFCSETKAMQTKFNFTKYYHLYRNNDMNFDEFTEEEQHKFEHVSLVCDNHLAPKNSTKFSSGAELVQNVKEVSPNLTEVLFGCIWNDTIKTSCDDIFSPIVTEEGICHTFNILGAQEMFRIENLHMDYVYLEHEHKAESWTLEDGYSKSAPLETYPYRGSGTGAYHGLKFLLHTKGIHMDYLCRGPVQGFKIFLHNPAELPRASKHFRMSLDQEVMVAVKPKMMTTSKGLASYDANVRQCYFQSERSLLYFKVYSQANCEMECLSNYTNAMCGCVHFGMPYGPNMRVCSSGSITCMKKAQSELAKVVMESNIESKSYVTDTPGEVRKIAEKCRCLPACTSIEYEAEISQASYNWKALYQAFSMTVDSDDEDLMYSRAVIFYKEPQFITSRRSELYGRADFLANCGGLLGLFMGFSLLSITEILYFLTLRIISALRKKKYVKDNKQEGFRQIEISEDTPMPQFHVD